jgi:stage II sporulation protein D
MSPSFPAEALKAQAVAARNYAVKNMGRHAGDGYDLCDQDHCQVWNPKSHHPNTDKAVDATTGIGAALNDSVINTTQKRRKGQIFIFYLTSLKINFKDLTPKIDDSQN